MRIIYVQTARLLGHPGVDTEIYATNASRDLTITDLISIIVSGIGTMAIFLCSYSSLYLIWPWLELCESMGLLEESIQTKNWHGIFLRISMFNTSLLDLLSLSLE